jgi:para-nitrobenzyl esterase
MRNKWFIRFAVLIIFVAVRSSAFPARAQTVACQVAIDSGVIAGVQVGQSCVYKGIPYAASPAGAGRWRPPAPVVPWSGVRSAANFGPVCPQLQGTTAVGNEDCLNLNIFAPTNATPSLPVIFFMHGGGHRSSSNRAEGAGSLDGRYLAEHGPAVVVVINYRLGALGWLAHPALDVESATGTSGNYGILDEIFALQWVQRNIPAFGGDPSRVMITGHSAGAQDSGVLLASPLAHGLFARVLIDGGGFTQFDSPNLPAYEASFYPQGAGMDVVSKLGCSTATDIPACLRAVPSATIVKTVPGVGGVFQESTYRAILDGFVLHENVLQTAKEGGHNHVPLIIGGGDRETANPNAYIPLNADPDDTTYKADVYALFGQQVGDQVLALYPSINYPKPRDAFVAATTDYRFLCPARQLARAVSNSQQEPVYRFVFTHAQSNPPVANPQGAWHGEELMFIFHSSTPGPAVFGPFVASADELTLSDQMIGYWGRFAATGNPNGGDVLPWFLYGQNADNNGQGNMFFNNTALGDDKKDTFLQFETPLAEGAGFHAEVCENFWDVLVSDTNNGHGEGSFTGGNNENAGNETFITDADLDNDDQPPPPKD